MSNEEHPKDRNKSPEKRPAPISQPPSAPATPPASGDDAKAPISFGHAPSESVPNYFPPQGQYGPPGQYPPQYPQPGQYGPPGQFPPAGSYPPPGQYPPAGPYPPSGQYPPASPYGPTAYPNQYPTQWPGAPAAPLTPQAPPAQAQPPQPQPQSPAAPPTPAVSAPTSPPAAAVPAPQQPIKPAKSAPSKPQTPASKPTPAAKQSPPAKQPPAAKPPKPSDSNPPSEPPKWRGETKEAPQPKQPLGEKTPASPPAEPKKAPKRPETSPSRKTRRDDKVSDKSAPVESVPTNRKGLPQRAPQRTEPEILNPGLLVAEHEAGADDLTTKSTRMMPPWMISSIIHFVLVVVLAMLVFTPQQKQSVVVTATYAEKLGEQLDMDLILDEEDLMEDEIVGFDITLFESEQPPPESLTTLAADGAKSKQTEVETPGVEYNFRTDGGGKKALLKAYGGTATTEQAIKEALEWLKRNQRRDGSWSLKGPYNDGAGIENHVAATAMALLAFQGAGHTTLEGAYVKEVTRGWDFLMAQMDNDGTFISGPLANQHRLYTQAQATIALCELYGMTHDEKYRKPAQRAIDYAVRIQSPEGGWRYTPGDGADLSVTGWFVIAFASAKMCGLTVPEDTLQRVGGFLDTVAKENGARYTYQPTRNQPPTLSMTAEGLLCRQYLGWKHEDPRLADGVDYLVGNPINWKEPDVYYWYYGTQVAHHFEGPAWQDWNKVMRQAIPERQAKVGSDKGSWSPDGDKHGIIGGRLFMTCLCVYMLEVYYRHLPIYSKSEVLSLQ